MVELSEYSWLWGKVSDIIEYVLKSPTFRLKLRIEKVGRNRIRESRISLMKSWPYLSSAAIMNPLMNQDYPNLLHEWWHCVSLYQVLATNFWSHLSTCLDTLYSGYHTVAPVSQSCTACAICSFIHMFYTFPFLLIFYISMISSIMAYSLICVDLSLSLKSYSQHWLSIALCKFLLNS